MNLHARQAQHGILEKWSRVTGRVLKLMLTLLCVDRARSRAVIWLRDVEVVCARLVASPTRTPAKATRDHPKPGSTYFVRTNTYPPPAAYHGQDPQHSDPALPPARHHHPRDDGRLGHRPQLVQLLSARDVSRIINLTSRLVSIDMAGYNTSGWL